MADGNGEESMEGEVDESLNQLPELVWKKILLENFWSWDYPSMLEMFAAVKLPGDFLSNPVLDLVQKNVVFHVLFPTLASNYVGSGSRSPDEDEDPDEDDHPSLLDFEDIYNCRLVCRAWNSAIQKNVVEHVSRYPPRCDVHEWENNFLWPTDSRNPYANHCNSAYSDCSCTSDLVKAWSYFEDNHQRRGEMNPIHCHHVSFSLASRNASPMWVDVTEIIVASAAEFFAQFGNHLRLLNLLLYLRETGFGRYYHGVLDLLRECPNLEALRISWLCHYDIEAFWTCKYIMYNMNAGSFPELTSLTNLEVDGLPHSLFNDIIKSNGDHIEKLKISDLEVGRFARFRKYALHRVPLSNLLELHLDHFRVRHPERYRPVGEISPSLDKVEESKAGLRRRRRRSKEHFLASHSPMSQQILGDRHPPLAAFSHTRFTIKRGPTP